MMVAGLSLCFGARAIVAALSGADEVRGLRPGRRDRAKQMVP